MGPATAPGIVGAGEPDTTRTRGRKAALIAMIVAGVAGRHFATPSGPHGWNPDPVRQADGFGVIGGTRVVAIASTVP